MSAPKFPRGSIVTFNEEPATVLYLKILGAIMGQRTEDFFDIFIVQDLEDPETDWLGEWSVCIRNAWGEETWVSEVFLCFAESTALH